MVASTPLQEENMGIGITLSMVGIFVAATVNSLSREHARIERGKEIIPGQHWDAVDFTRWA
ncbi:MAG: hypothetical protein DI609_11295 [Corynebacterium urealyticum]|uniref:Uncharacterized protein n=1 Tax=Corynebacterium urealyticum TaxID=43771 RepID=A0A2W5AXX3_9CORY|nr:MAG: hypothetical protein DI609_11295 [Corynebacterium urealyticum]